jgi:hypothetical protein
MLTKADIEKPRTPRGLRLFVRSRIRQAESDRSERHKAFLNKGLYKYFNNEIIPLSVFSLLHFRSGVLIKPVLGNQGFDAEILNDQFEIIGHIEITNPHDGVAAHRDGKLLVERGFSEINVFSPGSDLTRMFSNIFRTCKKKSEKDYGDSILVITVNFSPPSKDFMHFYLRRSSDLQAKLREITFRAKEVHLLIMPLRRLYLVQAVQ